MQCVEQALIVKPNAAQRRLVDLRNNGILFEHPLSDLTTQVGWEKDPKKRMIQILLMPLVFIIIIFLLMLMLTVPIAYIFNIWTTHRIKRDLEKEIKLYDLNIDNINKPKFKTVESLWELHGLNEAKYTTDECIALLSKWITILYGADIAMNINICHRMDVMAANRIELNRPYYENQSNSTHFHFAPIFPSIIVLISNKLTAYAPED